MGQDKTPDTSASWFSAPPLFGSAALGVLARMQSWANEYTASVDEILSEESAASNNKQEKLSEEATRTAERINEEEEAALAALAEENEKTEYAASLVSNMRENVFAFVQKLPTYANLRGSTRYSMQQFENRFADMDKLLAHRASIIEQMESGQRQNARKRTEKLHQLFDEKSDELVDAAQQKFNERRNLLLRQYGKKLTEGFDVDHAKRYIARGESLLEAKKHFRPATRIAPEILLGTACYENNCDNDNIDYMLEQHLPDFTDEEEEGRDTLSLPYIHRTDTSLKLLLSYVQGEDEDPACIVDSAARQFIMSFPKGKLDAVLIDSVGLGSKFERTRRFAEDTGMSGQVFTFATRSDIKKALGAVIQKIAKDIRTGQNDGTHTLLAITDFPQGFSYESMQDLSRIIQHAGNGNVHVLISAETSAWKKLFDDNLYAETLSQIRESCLYAWEDDDRTFHLSNGELDDSYLLF